MTIRCLKGEDMVELKPQPLKYCYVTGGKNHLNFHGWLSELTINRLVTDGCNIEVLYIRNINY